MRCVASESPISHLEAFVSADVEWGIYYPSTPPSFYGGGSDNGNSTADSGTTTESNKDAAPHFGPADPKYGLPTAPLGVDFDISLDDCFGYETLSDTDYVAYVNLMANATVLEDGPENIANISGDLESDEYLMNKILLVHSRFCTYTNVTHPPKLFVVENVETRLDILQSPDLESIVTGGPVDECYYLPIMAGRTLTMGTMRMKVMKGAVQTMIQRCSGIAGITNLPTSEWPLDFHILNKLDPFAHTVPSQLQNFQSYRFNSLIALSP